MIAQVIKDSARELGLVVTDEAIDSLTRYSEELLKWNRKINLTAITAEKDIAVKHFIDALYFAEYVNAGDYVLDIGSGAGVPGIPLAITKPEVKVVSVDAVSKKIQFQKHIARCLGLCNFEAIHARVETLRENYSHAFSLITSRAFSSLEQFVLLAAPLLADNGRMIAMKGPASSAEIAEMEHQLKPAGFEISSVVDYELPSNYGKRCLIVITHCKI